jgi:hypothetical protein
VAAPIFGMSGIFTLPFTASTYLPLTQDTIDYGDNSQVVIVSGTPSYASVGGYDSIVLSNSSLTIKYMNSSSVTISLWFYPTDQITASTLLRLTNVGGTSRMTIYLNNTPGKVSCDFPLWGFVLEGSFVVNSWNLVTLVMLNEKIKDDFLTGEVYIKRYRITLNKATGKEYLNQAFIVKVDKTPFLNLPLAKDNNIEQIYNQAILTIDSKIKELSAGVK